MWKSLSWVAARRGVTRQTIHRWITIGKYDRSKVQKTEGGHYRVWCPPEEFCSYGYCRVSSAKQSSSLDTQEQLIRAAHPELMHIVRDVGSGFNFNRPGIKAILEQCVSGVAVTIVATTQDRVTKSGFPFLKWIVELYGGRFVFLEENDTPEEFDTKTLVAFISSFLASYHGKRSGRKKAFGKAIGKASRMPKDTAISS